MEKKLKIFFLIFTFLSAACAIPFSYYENHLKFNGTLLHKEFSNREQWDFSFSPDRTLLSSIFSQRFFSLKEGGQAIAFISEDQNYVIKFFKKEHERKKTFFQRLFPKPILSIILRNAKSSKLQKWKNKLIANYDSYALAYKEFRDETGLIVLHFNKTPSLNLNLKLVNCFGKEYVLTLDEYEFILQKKAIVLQDFLKPLKINKNFSELKKQLLKVFHFFEQRTKKGLTDPRRSLNINFGFIEDRIVQFDAGKLIKQDFVNSSFLEELRRLSFSYKQWLKKHYPEVEEEIIREIDKKLYNL